MKSAMKPALLEQLTASPGKVERLALDLIATQRGVQRSVDGEDLADYLRIGGPSIQLRESTNQETVARYAEAYAGGAAMPPIVVFIDTHGHAPRRSWEYHLADGHHRVAAARKAGLKKINAITKKGDHRAAVLYGAGANDLHGLPLTNGDKRKIVSTLLADTEWKQWSDRQIAEASHVSPNFVGKIRKEVGAQVETIKRKDGKTQAKPAAPAKPKDKASVQINKTAATERASEVDIIWEILLNCWRYIPHLADLEVSESRARILSALMLFPATVDGPMPRHIVTLNARASDPEKDQQRMIAAGIIQETPAGELYIFEEVMIALEKACHKELTQVNPERYGPEEILLPLPKSSTPAPSAPVTPPPAPPAPAAPQTLAERRLIREREIVHERMLKGKPQWKGTDGDLFALALICGVPTRSTAWCDAVRATSRDAFIDALRSEIALRIRNGETTHRRWPTIRELCYLWGIDHEAITILAERGVTE